MVPPKKDPRPLQVLRLTIEHATSQTIGRESKFFYDEVTTHSSSGFFDWQIERPPDRYADCSVKCPYCGDLLTLRIYSCADSVKREKRGRVFRSLLAVATALLILTGFLWFHVANNGNSDWAVLGFLSFLLAIFAFMATGAAHGVVRDSSLVATGNSTFHLARPFYCQPKTHLVTGIDGY